MAEAGILSHPERVELIDGLIFDMKRSGAGTPPSREGSSRGSLAPSPTEPCSSASRIPCVSTPITSPSRILWP
jgi:hypothetical protein